MVDYHWAVSSVERRTRGLNASYWQYSWCRVGVVVSCWYLVQNAIAGGSLRQESYGSMHFRVWNHMIPCLELHGRSVGHGCMHGIVWNHTDHMLPCMEMHGSLMNLDPGTYEFSRFHKKLPYMHACSMEKVPTRVVGHF